MCAQRKRRQRANESGLQKVLFEHAVLEARWRLCVSARERPEVRESRAAAHLEALGADSLAFLPPGDSGFGLPGGLAHKRRDSSRDARLVLRGYDETRHT